MLVPNLSYQPQQLTNQTIQKMPTNVANANTTATPSFMPSAGLLQAYYSPLPAVPKKPEVKSIWANSSEQKKQNIQQMGEHFKAFLNNSKTDLTTVDTMVQRAVSEGFQPWPQNDPGRTLVPGEKFFRVNRDRSMQLIVIGKEPISNGFKMVGTHIDSPHISLKPQALQDGAGGFAIFKTKIHGGIKPHQWSQRNLALVGKVIKEDGTTVKIDIGNKPSDPVFIIPELAPHVDNERNGKNPPLENLNPIVGSNEVVSLDGKSESSISDQVERILYANYGLTRNDLKNAQLDLVPASEARDVGFDRSMVSGFGTDNKTSAYAGMEALISSVKYNPVPNKTLVCANFGNEEISSWNNYGAKSDDTRLMMGEIMKYTTGTYDELALKHGFKNSLIVSADVSTAIDPINPGAEDGSNAAKLGYGPAIAIEGQLTATPETTATFNNIIKGTQTQTHTFNQDKGGGGTLGNYIATQNNADVVDIGVPVIGMHSPNEIIHKADLYELTTALQSYFLR
ncbi:MAG: hypothetical protein AB7V50_03065 [Vampirovibrionia bacterium]